jgi:hypothetical protein
MAQITKSQLQSSINTNLADNTSGDISAADVRNNFIDVTDSLLFNNDSQILTGSLTVDEGYIANFPTNSIALTIPTGYNALLVGPIYNSSSITVQPGARLVII